MNITMTYTPTTLKTDWNTILAEEFTKPYFQNLRYALAQEYKQAKICPPKEEIFNAFNLTPFTKTKVVIIGQDPYHGESEAHGLSFSVKPHIKIPPSLRNIFAEMVQDLGCPMPQLGDLTPWAKQGVLLLNTSLTVRLKQPNSHQNIGWSNFTDQVISTIDNLKQHICFILWGKQAQAKGKFIDRSKHYVIESAHPSPLSAHRGFFGSKPFSKVNNFLVSKNLEPVNWSF